MEKGTNEVTPEVVRGLVESAVAKMQDKIGEEVREAIRDLTPDRSKLGDPAPRGSGIRLMDPRAHLYERMKRQDPEMAAFRSSDSDHWSAAWLRAHADGDHTAMRRAEDELAKLYGRATLVEGTTTATSGLSQGSAGAMIPLPLAGAIQLTLNRRSKIRSLATIANSAGKTLRVPRSGAATAAMVAEGATATQGEPTVDSVLLDKKKQQAQFGVSRETMRDSSYDLTGFFSERAGSAFGEMEDVQICTSNGTPPNISGNITNGVTDFAEASAGTLTYVDWLNFFYTLPEQYLANASILVASNVAAFLSRLSHASGGVPILVPIQGAAGVAGTIGDGAHVIGTVFGRPVFIVPLAAGSCVLGDIRRGYTLLEDPGIEVEASTHAGWSTDSVLWKFTRRFDGNVIIADAMRRFAGITAIG